MRLTRLPPMLCPSCAKVVDTHGDLIEHGQKVKGGDFTICLECSAVLRFTDDVRALQVATAAEMAEAPEQITEARRLVRAYKEYCKTHPRPPARSLLS